MGPELMGINAGQAGGRCSADLLMADGDPAADVVVRHASLLSQ